VVERAIVDNPLAANFEELGELYWDGKQYDKAREAFDRAIATRSDSGHCFYRRGLCLMADIGRASRRWEVRFLPR